MRMWLLQSSLLTALETPRLMKRKVNSEGRMLRGNDGSVVQASEFVGEKHTLIFYNCGSEGIRKSSLVSGVEISVKVINRIQFV